MLRSPCGRASPDRLWWNGTCVEPADALASRVQDPRADTNTDSDCGGDPRHDDPSAPNGVAPADALAGRVQDPRADTNTDSAGGDPRTVTGQVVQRSFWLS